MSEEKFTPGPWVYESEDGFYSEIIGANGDTVCVFAEDPEKVADVDLMEAAPDLYAALSAVEWVEDVNIAVRFCPGCKKYEALGHFPRCNLNAALKKARGES